MPLAAGWILDGEGPNMDSVALLECPVGEGLRQHRRDGLRGSGNLLSGPSGRRSATDRRL